MLEKKRSSRARLHALAATIVCALAMLAPTQAFAVCHTYNSDLAVSHAVFWKKTLGSPSTYIEYQSYGGSGAEIEVVAGGGTNKLLRLWGWGGVVHQMDFSLAGVYPTDVDLLVWSQAGAVTVEAYDGSGNLVDSDVSPSNVPTLVQLSGDEIAYVLILDSGNELHIDDVCFT
jgi:hypothetical protein